MVEVDVVDVDVDVDGSMMQLSISMLTPKQEFEFKHVLVLLCSNSLEQSLHGPQFDQDAVWNWVFFVAFPSEKNLSGLDIILMYKKNFS